MSGFAIKELRPDLAKAFESVQDPDDWRGPINAKVPSSSLDLVIEAIKWYCGCNVEARPACEPGFWFVRAIGYRMGPCGP